MTNHIVGCEAPDQSPSPAAPPQREALDQSRAMGVAEDRRAMVSDLCSGREFERRMNGLMDARPHTRWHLEGSARRIHSTLQEACRHLRRDSTVVDLGCLPPNMIYGFHVAGLLPHLNYVGTCIEGPGDKAFDDARSLGVRFERVNLDPRFALFDDPADLPARLPLPDGSVDLIILMEVLDHLVWPHTILDECLRLLKPDGVIVVAQG